MDRIRPDGQTSAHLQLELPARPQSVAKARASLAALAALDDAVRQVLLIVVSELVTNAVRHAGLTSDACVTLRAMELGDRVRVEVVDHGSGFDMARVAEIQPSCDGGFGLRIVAQLAESWGVLPADGTVWAEVATHSASLPH